MISCLFIMIMDVLTEGVRNGSLMDLLSAGDLILCGESLNEVTGKYRRCKYPAECFKSGS